MKALTFDTGSNSLAHGVAEGDNISGGVKLFHSRNNYTSSSKQSERGDYRRTRKQVQRTKKRKNKVYQYFKGSGITCTQNDFSRSNPYALRVKGLTEQLTPQEQLIIAINFAVNRGFLSSHTASDGIEDEEEKINYKIVEEMEQLRGDLTPGQVLNTKKETVVEEVFVEGTDVYNRLQELGIVCHLKEVKALDFKVYKTEQENSYRLVREVRSGEMGELTPEQFINAATGGNVKRYKKYSKHSNSFLRESVRNEYRMIAANQENDLLSNIEDAIFFQRSPYFHESTISNCPFDSNEKVAHKAQREYQKYVVSTFIDNIRYYEGYPKPLPESIKEQLMVLSMNGVGTSWKKLRTMMGANSNVGFNYESCEKSVLSSTTDKKMIKAHASWTGLPENVKDSIVSILLEEKLNYSSLNTVAQRLCDTHSLDFEIAKKFAATPLESERGGISLKSISRYFAGERLELDIPYCDGVSYAKSICNNHIQISNVTHAVKILNQHHENLSKVFVEVVADPFVNKEESIKENNRNRKNKEIARKWLDNSPYPVTSSNIRKRVCYTRQKGLTIYSELEIDERSLYETGLYNFDHIIPQSKYCDNSRENLALELSSINKEKGDKLVTDWLPEDRVKAIVERVATWGVAGIAERISLKELPDSFCARDINQTAYSAKLIIQSLRAEIAYNNWDIEVIPVASDAAAKARKELGWKKDRDNHRHHIEDCVLLAVFCVHDDVKSGIADLKAKESLMREAVENGTIENIQQRADRGGFADRTAIPFLNTKNKEEKITINKEGMIQIGKNAVGIKAGVREMVGNQCRAVSNGLKCYIHEENGKYKFLFVNQWERMKNSWKEKHASLNIVSTLQKGEVVKVINEDGSISKYYLREINGLRLHPLEQTEIQGKKKDRKNYFSLKNKRLKFSKPDYQDTKEGVRLIAEYRDL